MPCIIFYCIFCQGEEGRKTTVHGELNSSVDYLHEYKRRKMEEKEGDLKKVSMEATWRRNIDRNSKLGNVRRISKGKGDKRVRVQKKMSKLKTMHDYVINKEEPENHKNCNNDEDDQRPRQRVMGVDRERVEWTSENANKNANTEEVEGKSKDVLAAQLDSTAGSNNVASVDETEELDYESEDRHSDDDVDDLEDVGDEETASWSAAEDEDDAGQDGFLHPENP